MAKKNLCGVEIEYAEDNEFHDGMFHCYGARTVNGKNDSNDKTNNFVTVESGDGECAKVIAMCPDFADAKAIVCAMGIAKSVVDNAVGKAKDSMGRLREIGYDLAATEAKVNELMNEGKTLEEILEYMLAHHSDFLVKKPDAKPTGDSKERW